VVGAFVCEVLKVTSPPNWAEAGEEVNKSNLVVLFYERTAVIACGLRSRGSFQTEGVMTGLDETEGAKILEGGEIILNE